MSSFSTPSFQKEFYAISLLGILSLFALILFSPKPLIYDEVPYLAPVALLEKYGFSKTFLIEYPVVTGLTHNLLHWWMKPLTHLIPPLVRLINPIFLLLTMGLCFFLAKQIQSQNPKQVSMSLLAIPYLWVVSGLALTELSAIFFMTLSLLLLFHILLSKKETWLYLYFFPFLAGGILGIAVLGRQSVLPIVAGLPFLLTRKNKRNYSVIGFYLLAMLTVTLPVFMIWGGLIPDQHQTLLEGKILNPTNIFYALAYAAIGMVILAPRWFQLPNPICYWALAGIVICLNLIFGFLSLSPLFTVAKRLLPPPLFVAYTRLCGSLFLCIGVWFFTASLLRFHESLFHKSHYLSEVHSSLWRFLWIALFVSLFAQSRVIYSFSSRYIAIYAPILLILASPYMQFTFFHLVRLGIGQILGLLSLASYLIL